MHDLTKGQQLARSYKAKRSARSIWIAKWERAAEWVAPQDAEVKAGEQLQVESPVVTERAHVHDTTAIKASSKLGNAHMSFITPLGEQWMRYEPPIGLEDNEAAKGWYKRCSEIVMDKLSSSNFYTEVHQVYNDRAKFGTGAHLTLITNGKLHFRYVSLGMFDFEESMTGEINDFCYEEYWTLAQIVEEWGEDNLGEKLKEKCTQARQKSEEWGRQYMVVTHIKERSQAERELTNTGQAKYDQKNKAFGKYVLCMEDEDHIIEEGGFDNMIATVSRYHKWGRHKWGFTPTFNALPDIHSANYFFMLLKTIGEGHAMPRLVALAESLHQIDLRAGGITYVSKEGAAMNMPKEIGSQARFDVGAALLEMLQKSIEDFYHVPLFQMLHDIDRQMTATEVAAREREKLLLFAPSFTQFVTDMNPMMLRIFTELLKQGIFPDPPAGVFETTDDGTKVRVEDPKVSYQSKVALAIKALQGEGLDRVMARMLPLFEAAPDVLDNFDLDKIVRDLSRNENVPDRWLKDWEEVKDMRDQRAAEMQQMQEMAMVEQAAKASGQASPENIAQLQDMAEQAEVEAS